MCNKIELKSTKSTLAKSDVTHIRHEELKSKTMTD